MATIDERVVSLKFNNSQFEQGIKQSSESLKKFSSFPGLDGLRSGFEKINGLFSGFSLSGMSSQVEGVSSKFSFLQQTASTAFGIITAKAAMAGSQMVASFAFKPINDGFAEYETKLGSIQTILANTQSQGTTLTDVSASLRDLNNYADKTIYSFGDMTKNISLFTNAGLGLKQSTSMITGFSNAAAASGTNAQAAAGAAYQLSQALSAGTIRLMDWRSLQNAGMGNKNMQQGLVDIADAMGTLTASGTNSTEVMSNFNGSLENGWLSADVMSKYLQIMAGDMDAATMSSLGLTDAQIQSFQQQQATAEEAATKVRSFTQLVGTVGEAIGSGWAQSWEIIIGDFDEATDLFTRINNGISPVITNIDNLRNSLLQGWSDLGGRTMMIESFANVFKALGMVVTPIKMAFKQLFPPVTAQTLMDLTTKFSNLSQTLLLVQNYTRPIQRIFAGLFAVIKIGVNFVKALASGLGDLLPNVGDAAGGILEFAAGIGDWLVKLSAATEKTDFFKTVVGSIVGVIQAVIDKVKDFGSWIKEVFDNGMSKVSEKFKGHMTMVDFFQALVDKMKSLSSIGDSVGGFLKKLGGWISDAVSAVVDSGAGDKLVGFFGNVKDALIEFKDNGGFGILFGALLTGGGLSALSKLGGIGTSVTDFLKGLKDSLGGGSEKEGLVGKIKNTFGAVTDGLKNMQSTLKVTSLVAIAMAIGVLVLAIAKLSTIDAGSLTKAITAIGVMMTELTAMLAGVTKVMDPEKSRRILSVAIALVAFAAALKIMASAVDDLGKLDMKTLGKGLLGVGVILAEIGLFSSLINVNGKGVIRAGIAMVIFAGALKLLTSSVKDVGTIDTDTLKKGLLGVGAILLEMGIFTRLASGAKGMIQSSVGILVVAAALKILVSVIEDVKDMSWEEIAKGLAVIAGAVVSIGAALALIPATGVLGAAGILIVSFALKKIGEVVKDLAKMSWGEIARSLVALAGALVLIVAATIAMDGAIIGAASMIVVAKALEIMIPPLIALGDMSWGEIAKAMVALAGAMVILAVGVTAMTFAVIGAPALVVIAAALALLVPVLIALGDMSWGEIGKGLTALAGALVILAVGGMLLTAALPGLMGLGIAIGLIGVGVGVASAGLASLVSALTALSTAGSGLSDVITQGLQGIVDFIPSIATSVGQGFINILDVITNNSTSIVNAATTIVSSILTAIQNTAPQFGQVMIMLITIMCDVINQCAPQLVQTGINLILLFLNAIRDNISDIVNIASDIIVRFINGVASNIPRIIASAIDLAIAFINGLANGLRSRQDEVNSATRNLISAMGTTAVSALGGVVSSVWSSAADIGRNIVSGITSGIANGASSIASSAYNAAKNALDSAKNALGIHSPSREFMKVGRWSMIGFANGIDEYASRAEMASTGSAKATVTAFVKAAREADGAFDNLSVGQPIVRPVLDLANIESGASKIQGMFDGQTLDTSLTVNSANAAVKTNDKLDPQAASPEQKYGDINFTQVIQSPTALNHYEIYRQTKIQTINMKEALNAL